MQKKKNLNGVLVMNQLQPYHRMDVLKSSVLEIRQLQQRPKTRIFQLHAKCQLTIETQAVNQYNALQKQKLAQGVNE